LIFNVLWIAGHFRFNSDEAFSFWEEEAVFFSQTVTFSSSPEI
jgi:hypothetical protein